MMKAVLLTIFLAFALETVIVTSKIHNYDNFDIDTILSSKEKTKKFVECMHDDKNCETPSDLEFKMDIQEMLATGCKVCTEKETIKFQQALEAMANHPSDD